MSKIIKPGPKLSSVSAPKFPPAWTWLVDEAIPQWVKKTYSPQESWKEKPFSKMDAEFFFKGIDDLSELFTDERPSDMPAYFQHPKYRSSYLLYFLPLQAAKFISLFGMYPDALEAALEHGKRTGTLRLVDLGAGPGTASIAFLLTLLTRQDLPASMKIELQWLDTNKAIQEDGKALVEILSSHFPKLRGRVTTTFHTAPWWEAPRLVKDETSLVILGHVLNETPKLLEREDSDSPTFLALSHLIQNAHGAGILMVDPANRRASQLLSRVRDRLIDTEVVPHDASSIWGPCLHAERCPLAMGRDWCHFSIPAEIPGKWFSSFSKGLGSERSWLKFSYLWLSSQEFRPKPAASHIRRVVSDPIQRERGPGMASVLLCEPEIPGRITVRMPNPIKRGDLININAYERSKPRE